MQRRRSNLKTPLSRVGGCLEYTRQPKQTTPQPPIYATEPTTAVHGSPDPGPLFNSWSWKFKGRVVDADCDADGDAHPLLWSADYYPLLLLRSPHRPDASTGCVDTENRGLVHLKPIIRLPNINFFDIDTLPLQTESIIWNYLHIHFSIPVTFNTKNFLKIILSQSYSYLDVRTTHRKITATVESLFLFLLCPRQEHVLESN